MYHIYQAALTIGGTIVSLGIIGFVAISLVYIVYDKLTHKD